MAGKRVDARAVKHLSSRVVNEVRDIAGMGGWVMDVGRVDTVRNELNEVLVKHLKQGAMMVDVALGLVLSIKGFGQASLAVSFPDDRQREAMAEQLWAAITQAVKEGCNVTLTDD